MANVTKEFEALVQYMFRIMKWGEDAVPIALLCIEHGEYGEMAAEVLDYIKSTPNITPEAAGDKAQELRDKKYGKSKFVVVNDDN
ncbi:MAG: hypothetical protein J1G01_04485 [Clostridiales bacterium]|nr:hypothetical protein [Clostridiales bacterium]